MGFHTTDTSLPVDRTIAAGDTMMVSGLEHQYWQIGQRALELVKFSANLCDKPHYPHILDLGCGYGRVMRWLRAGFDYAQITACDLDRDGVDFCVERFGAVPAYSDPDLGKLPFRENFDLVWVGSVFTHLPHDRWLDTLDHIVKWTRPCGVIILSTQGRYFTSWIARGEATAADDVNKQALLKEFSESGFSYQPYFSSPDGSYGLTVTSPEWLTRTLQRYPGLIIRSYIEEVWGVQDIVVLYKSENYFEPLLGLPERNR